MRWSMLSLLSKPHWFYSTFNQMSDPAFNATWLLHSVSRQLGSTYSTSLITIPHSSYILTRCYQRRSCASKIIPAVSTHCERFHAGIAWDLGTQAGVGDQLRLSLLNTRFAFQVSFGFCWGIVDQICILCWILRFLWICTGSLFRVLRECVFRLFELGFRLGALGFALVRHWRSLLCCIFGWSLRRFSWFRLMNLPS